MSTEKTTVTISSSALLSALKKVKPAIPKGSVLPILEDTYIKSGANFIQVHGYNLEMAIVITVPAECVEGIEFCTDIAKLTKLCSSFPFSNLTFSHDAINNKLSISCEGSEFELSTDPVGDYPVMPIPSEVLAQKDMDGGLIEDCLKALKFTSSDTLRPQMTGVYFDYSDRKLHIVATDAHCLFVSEAYTGESPRSYIVPADCLKVVCANAKKGGGSISFTETHAVYDNRDTVIICRLIDATFPPYRQIIPGGSKYFSVNRRQIMNAVNTVLPFSNRVTNMVHLEINGELKIEASDMDFGTSSHTKVPIRFSNVGDFHCAFNGSFLSKAISCVDANHVKLFNEGDNKKAFVVRSGDSDAVILVMPLMVA